MTRVADDDDMDDNATLIRSSASSTSSTSSASPSFPSRARTASLLPALRPLTSRCAFGCAAIGRNNLIASFSNLSTAYNLVNVQLVHVMLEDEYCSSNGSGDEECASLTVAIGTACLVGAILGQLTFGYVGDCLGRGPALRLTMVLSVLGALVSAFAVPIGEDPKVRRGAVWRRGYTGLGFVGVWPMACTVCSVQCYSVHR